MPSPIGHALAGVAIAWTMTPRAETSESLHHTASTATVGNGRDDGPWQPLTWLCAALAALPDADLLTPWPHRTVTHSIGAVVMIFIIATLVTRWVTVRQGARIVLACTVAYASHLLLDWLAIDDHWPYGLQILWPLSDRWFISRWDIFLQTARPHVFSAAAMAVNLRAATREVLILGPILGLVWIARWGRAFGRAAVSTRRIRARSSVQADRRRPSGEAAGTDGTSGRQGLPAER